MSNAISRRTFLRDNCLATAGATGAILAMGSGTAQSVQASPPGGSYASDANPSPGGPGYPSEAKGRTPLQASSPEQRLRELGIELPPAPEPVAVYVTSVVTGNLLFTSGHGPAQIEGVTTQGRVGADLSIEEGYAAARATGLAVLSTLRNSLGSLDNVVRLVKTLGMVNCTTDFTQQPAVVNGFSELMVDVFGEELGRGGRSAVGMGSLPFNIACEIEAIFEVRG